MNVSLIDGLKYPDEYFTKYFFKNRLHTGEVKKFIEFGAGNGNNLMLPYQYGHEIIGIDFDLTLTKYANSNFEKLKQDNRYQFYADDMRNFVKNHQNLKCDVLLLPSIIYYITKDDLISFFDLLLKNNIIKDNADFFIRVRSIKDFRFGIGQKIDDYTYKIPDDYNITGEAGCINRFYQEDELIWLLKTELNLRDYKVFQLDCQNLQNNVILLNSDIVIWGKIL